MKRSALIGAPYYSLKRYSGMGEGPAALRGAGILGALGSPADHGDAAIPLLSADVEGPGVKNLGHFASSADIIREKVGSVDADVYYVIGGECSVAVGTMAGLAGRVKGKPGMLWMDAHGDFNTPETSPSGYVGGMCLAMLCGRGPKISGKIDELRPMLSEERLVHLGSRALDPPEVSAFDGSAARLVTAQQVKKTGAGEAADETATHLDNRADWIVCHLDVDVIDPSELQAVNYPEPGGLASSEVASMLSALRRTGKLQVFELTSYNAAKDGDRASARLIVDLVRKAFGV